MTRPVQAPVRPGRPALGALTPRRLLGLAAIAAVLAAVFAAYFNPHLMVQLSNAVWACF